MIKNIVFLVVVIALILVGCSGGNLGKGILEGNVTIGLLTPVEQPGEKPPVPPEVYEARKVMVYDRSSRKLIKQVDLGQNGRYHVELSPGIYIVDINHIGIDHSRDVPSQIEIRLGETVWLDIDIDTGIR